ncbi:MAG: chemotaxis protein CheW [Bacteroidota bacterium]|nr:chemotaxis protein CheW [Bacteroidota bacterium]
MIPLLIFEIGNKHYAVHLEDVVKVFHAVAVCPLPGAPDVVSGIINMHGDIIPVLDIRKRLKIKEKSISIHDSFVLLKTKSRSFCIIVDSVDKSIDVSEDDIKVKDSIWPGLTIIDKIVSVTGEIILINNIENYFLPGEEEILDNSISVYNNK